MAVAQESKFILFKSKKKINSRYKDYNVILIVMDALRPDYLGCYGYSKNVSPNIDKLSKKSIIFENAFSQFPLTMPSVTSIFTSLYPYSHGTIKIFKDSVPERVYTMAQLFNIYGYNTAWFGNTDDPHTGSAKGLMKGYDNVKSNGLCDYTGIIKWIDENKINPFFITIHSYATHESSFPFQKFDNEFSRGVSLDKLDNIKEGEWYIFQDILDKEPDKLYNKLGREWVEKNRIYIEKPYSKENLKKLYSQAITLYQRFSLSAFLELNNAYYYPLVKEFDKKEFSDYLRLLDSSIFEVDRRLIGNLIRYIEYSGLDRRTLIIITADHGNEYLEHGGFAHGPAVYDESIHIPLILFLPDLAKGMRVKGLVQSIDILPTLLDLLGIPVPYQAQGISLVGLIEGKKDALHNEYIISQTMEPLFCIRSRDWKYIKNNVKEELYNLRHDKKEKNNLINKRYKIAEDLEECLQLKLNSLDVYKDRESEFLPFIDDETRENIKKTGYW